MVIQSPQLFGSTPSRIYDNTYQHDLPVLITSDSILYAFHRRYMDFLAKLETEQLSVLLHQVLSKTRDRLSEANLKGELDKTKAKDKVASLDAAFWDKNIYSSWLNAIASLHKNADDPRLPKVFRSDV